MGTVQSEAKGNPDPVEGIGVVDGTEETGESASYVPPEVDLLAHAKQEADEVAPAEEPKPEDVSGTSKPEKSEKATEDEKPPADPEPEKKDESKRDKVQERINKITREKYDEKRRADKAEAELERLREEREADKAARLQAELDTQKPVQSDFEEYEDYIVALGQWSAKKEIAADKQKAIEEKKESSEKDATIAADETVAERRERMFTDGREAHPDFEEKVFSFSPLTDAMVAALESSDVAHEILYHLANNNPDAVRIANLNSDIAIAREIGKIEAKFLTEQVEQVEIDESTSTEGKDPPKKKHTSAPEPIEPIGGTSTVKKDPSKMTNAEYRAWRNRNKDGSRKG